ncbi:MAG: UDP-N-acetylmuramoyl-tripeptide--D-alanyl-D-alanine ligase [Ruminococcus sp.]|nr:UDP-N-acetylmuramoyl-tripeptide--D-alanyl-D-alanine ligase [Ruminococcus sp.]
MKIKDILDIKGVKLLNGDVNTILDNLVYNTDNVTIDSTFLGLKGENTNGSKYYKEAFKKGAKTCVLCDIDISEEELNIYKDKNIIMTNDTLAFILEVTKRKRDILNIPIIAVTGSVGKTSTKNIIADILSIKYKVLKTSGNLNTNVGLAVTLMGITDENMIVLEMGMSKFGEIKELTNIAKPDVAVITNIGTAHIGNLGSRENILKAKLEILDGLKGPLIINNDNDMLYNWSKKTSIKNPIITFGIDKESNYKASNITYNKSGSHFRLREETVNNNVIGKHFIYNSLVAFAIGDLYDIPHQDIINKLKNIPLEPNRMELINKNNITIINDTYNASYDSVYYALEVLSSFDGRHIAVLGDILELGEFSEEIHRNIGKLIKENKIDFLITVGEESKYINEEALNNNFNHNNSYHFNSNKEAITFINNIKTINDTILIKASNGMNFIEIVSNI